MTRTARVLGLAIGTVLVTVGPLNGQDRANTVLAGYGSASYEASTGDDFRNDFTASVSPVLLYSMGSDVLFEAELEFGLSGDRTTTTLEYAQLDYLGFEKVQIIAGKFLLPFGVFGERLHPTWINKLPTAPILFGHAHGGVAEGALLPIMSDAGAMMRWAQPFGTNWSLDFSGWVSQGPRIADEEDAGDGDGHAHLRQAAVVESTPGLQGQTEADHAPPVAFGTSFSDNNKNKMIGGRLGLVKGGAFEVYVSGFHAMYDPDNYLDLKAGAISIEWRSGGFEFRSEGVLTSQEFEEADEFETVERSGIYAQASYRAGTWEPVARWGRLNDSKIHDESLDDSHNEFALGLVRWVRPSVPLKIVYEFHQGRDDEFAIQWAFGF